MRAADLAGEPAFTDGRDIDRDLGTLEGEASRVPVESKDASIGTGGYYGLPMLKPPVWKAWIPIYFHLGGLAGGAAVFAAAAELAGDRSLRAIVEPARFIGLGALALGSGALIADLGRPSRFIYMMRVVRPTSPMNVGTWILASAGAALGGAALTNHRALGVASGVLGLPLAGYTAVLLANTATPAWAHGAKSLPPLFVFSAITSAACALEFVGTKKSRRAIRAFGIAGKIGELVAEWAWTRELPEHVRPCAERGKAGVLLRVAKACTAASLVLDVIGRARIPSALLGTAGALVVRFAVMEAGRASATSVEASLSKPARAG